jgi:hypothetical protein
MKKINRYVFVAVTVALALCFTSNAFALFGKDKSEAEKQEEVKQEKADIRKMVNETLNRLYKSITSEQRYLLSEVAPVKAFFLIRKTIKKFS